MVTIKQLRKFLKDLPEDAEVQILHTYIRGWETHVDWIDLDLDPLKENANLIGNTLYLGLDD